MKLVRLIMTAALLVGPHADAGESAKTAATPGDKAELTALVEAWIDAEVVDDREALEHILHEDFVSPFASEKTVDRTAYIDLIISMDIPPFSVTNDFMAVYDDPAVVIDVSEDGKTKFTWIARRLNDEWNVIAQTLSSVQTQ